MSSNVSIASIQEGRLRFDVTALEELASVCSEAYRTAAPFPHLQISDFLPQAIADELLEEFAQPGTIAWKQHYHAHSRKLANNDLGQMGPRCREFLEQCNSPAMLRFLQRLTGIEGLIPDPYFVGGGLHQIERGGFLAVHADFNIHPQLKLHRRINMLLYLNRDWQEEYGGHLELWDRAMKGCRQKILPEFNRVVVFNTDDDSFHGHPDPLQCPEGRTRKSLALYYYTAGPQSVGAEPHSTLYQQRPGSADASLASSSARSKKGVFYWFVPPIVGYFVNKLRDRFIPK
jgi:Rps23 Pro-64 3,4-dihydroxylase Tpa1-like proline 4-hydroxylase